MLEEFGEYYSDYLDGTYDCVDRIVLSGYFRLGCESGILSSGYPIPASKWLMYK